MSDSVLDALIKAGASGDVIEQYVITKRKSLKHTSQQSQQQSPSTDVNLPKPPKPKRKCTEKQLAALAAGRAKNPNMIAKMKRLAEAQQQAKDSEVNNVKQDSKDVQQDADVKQDSNA